MKQNWDKAFNQVIVYEGGYVNHPQDPGGPTNLGITQATLSRYLGRAASIQDVKTLTKEGVKPIYKKFFWDVLRCDDLPGGVDLAVYDFGVNSGPSRAARYLQSVVGTAQDGIIGPITLEACNRYSAEEVIKKLMAKRLRFLVGLRTWATFGRGWKARLNSVEKVALTMAPLQTGAPSAGLSNVPPPDTSVRQESPVVGNQEGTEPQVQHNDGIGGLWGVKSPLASKTLWANVLGFLSVMPIIGGYLAGENLSQLAEAISAMIAAGSFIASSVFRVQAKYQLVAKPKTSA
jgi:lysozyme family protein